MKLFPLMALCLLSPCAPTRSIAGVAPDGDSTQVRSARPGETYRGSIALRNAGAAVVEVKLYQTDYEFHADGRNSFDSPGTGVRSNAKWLRLNREQVALGPEGNVNIDYEVQVPDDVRLSGTYWSVVMIQELSGPEASDPSRSGVKLVQSLRHAIQIVTEVGDAAHGEVVFRNARLQRDGFRRDFDVDLENIGERWLRTTVWLELHDSNGRFVGRFSAPRRRTFPGTSVRNHIELSGAPPGRYVGLLVADGGRNDMFGMQIDLDLR